MRQDTGTNAFTFILLVSDGEYTSTDKVSAFLPNVSGTNTPSEELRILLYPNPCTEYFKISVFDAEVNSVRLMDIRGKVLIHRNWTGGKEQTIELYNIPGGIYFVQVNSQDNTIIKKIIVL